MIYIHLLNAFIQNDLQMRNTAILKLIFLREHRSFHCWGAVKEFFFCFGHIHLLKTTFCRKLFCSECKGADPTAVLYVDINVSNFWQLLQVGGARQRKVMRTLSGSLMTKHTTAVWNIYTLHQVIVLMLTNTICRKRSKKQHNSPILHMLAHTI